MTWTTVTFALISVFFFPVKIRARAPHAYRAFFIGAYKYPYTNGAVPVGRLELLPEQKITVIGDCKHKDGGSDSVLFSVSLVNT